MILIYSNRMNSVFFYGSFQSLLFILLLVLKKDKKRTDMVLLFWFLFFAFHLLYPAFVFYHYPRFISYSGLDIGFFVIHLRFLDQYIAFFSDKRSPFIQTILFYVLIIIGSLSFVIPYLLMGKESRTLVMTGQIPIPFVMLFGAFLLLILGFLSLYSSWRKIRIYRKTLRQFVSNVDGLLLKWIDVLIISFLCYFLLILVFFILILIFPIQPHSADYIAYLGLVVLVIWIGYSGIRQGMVFISPLENKEESAVLQPDKDPDQLDIDFALQVREFVEEGKLYLNSDIRMSRLAEMMAVSPQRLSYILNSIIKESFYDFINSYRIKEVCSRIDSGDTDRLTILAIAIESGFNSKATFNRLFKKHKGMNPSEYRKKSQLIT